MGHMGGTLRPMESKGRMACPDAFADTEHRAGRMQLWFRAGHMLNNALIVCSFGFMLRLIHAQSMLCSPGIQWLPGLQMGQGVLRAMA